MSKNILKKFVQNCVQAPYDRPRILPGASERGVPHRQDRHVLLADTGHGGDDADFMGYSGNDRGNVICPL